MLNWKNIEKTRKVNCILLFVSPTFTGWKPSRQEVLASLGTSQNDQLCAHHSE